MLSHLPAAVAEQVGGAMNVLTSWLTGSLLAAGSLVVLLAAGSLVAHWLAH